MKRNSWTYMLFANMTFSPTSFISTRTAILHGGCWWFRTGRCWVSKVTPKITHILEIKPLNNNVLRRHVTQLPITAMHFTKIKLWKSFRNKLHYHHFQQVRHGAMPKLNHQSMQSINIGTLYPMNSNGTDATRKRRIQLVVILEIWRNSCKSNNFHKF